MMGYRYKISGALQTGLSHQAAGEPCQDRITVKREGPVFCCALADGAGSRLHSGLGAEAAVRGAAEMLLGNFDLLWEASQEEAAKTILRAVLMELEALSLPLPQLASTLLICAGDDRGRILTAHLGDGAMILAPGSGEPWVHSGPENGEARNETWFTTSPEALSHLRISRQQLTEPGTLLLMSDGVENSLLNHRTGLPAPGCAALGRWLRELPEDVGQQVLKKNLQASCSKYSGDDLSLIGITWDRNLEE